MISLLAQSEASDKLAKQAERHRELLEKEFTQSMERMKAEHEKTISEAIKSRDKYARSAHEATNSIEHTMQKIDQAQCDKVTNFQLECLRKRALRYEQELQEVTEKFEEEMRQKEIACDNQRKELAKERKKNKDLEKELRDYEDSVMSGVVPKSMISRKSPDSSPEVPKPKRIRKEEVEVNRDNKALTLNMSMTTAYTETPRDNSNIRVMTKDPSSIRPPSHHPNLQPTEQTVKETSARAALPAWADQDSTTSAVKSRAVLNPRLLPARVQTNAITIPIERAPGSCAYIEPEPPVITPEQKTEALNMWKFLLKETKDYVPHQHRSHEGHDKNIKFLSSAMKSFRESKVRGLKAMEWTHDRFGPLQNAMNIPKIFCLPDVFFEEAKRNQQVVYHKRCCSLYEFYRLLCTDTPGYVTSIKPPVGASNRGAKTDTRAHRPPKAHHGFSQKPSDNTWGDNQESSSAPVMYPSGLSIEQIESCEDAERRRNAPRRNAPIPSDGDSTEPEDDGYLFANKLLPSDKLIIKRLKKEIFRIKQHTQSQDYLWKRDKAIKAAEAERLAGGIGPHFLAGVKFPWFSDQGHAPGAYDDDQIDELNEQIERIMDENAKLCQLEYTATKGGPGGQGKR
jgi:hypothetical protein